MSVDCVHNYPKHDRRARLVRRKGKSNLSEIKSKIQAAMVPIVASMLFLVGVSAGSPHAEELKLEQQIVNALKPEPLTRGLTSSHHSAADRERHELIESLPTTRPLSVKEGEDVVPIAKSCKSIDLDVLFDYRSAELGDKAMPTVMALGRALTTPELKGAKFLVAGHTDAKGGATYNQKLSERRAEAVKRFLVHRFDIPDTDLVTVGYGKQQLKNKDEPFAAENRRVQVVNLRADKMAADDK